MRKKILAIIVVCIVVALSLLTLNLLDPPNKYEQTVARNVDNQKEEKALTAAESIDYSAITSFDRFDGSSDPEAYLHPGTYLAYTGARFIDSKVLNYYETRYADQQGKEYPKGITLTYEANVTEFSEFRIYNSPPPQGVDWHNITIVMSAPNDSVLTRQGLIQVFYKNQSDYPMVEWEYDFNFYDCYVVTMDLSYSEHYAPTAAYYSNVYQIVVLDRNLQPILIGIDSGKAAA